MDIKLLHQQGHSIRQIAKITASSRNSVRRVLRQNHPPQFRTPLRASKLDGFKDYIRKRHEECGLSAVRLHAEIAPMGFCGSIDILRRHLAELKVPAKRASKLTVRYETAPGQQAQADWKHCGRFPDAAGRTRRNLHQKFPAELPFKKIEFLDLPLNDVTL